MAIERHHTNDRMSQLVIHGDTVYLAGQVAQGAPGGTVAEQTTAILNQIDSLLAEAGTDKSKVLSATIWLCSMDDFAEMNAVWDAWATGGNAPCRACVESPRLAAPQFTVVAGPSEQIKQIGQEKKNTAARDDLRRVQAFSRAISNCWPLLEAVCGARDAAAELERGGADLREITTGLVSCFSPAIAVLF